MYWQGKKVVVTGGAGMIGCQLVRQLVDLGADVNVQVLDDFSRGLVYVKGATYSRGDAGDSQQCHRLLQDTSAVFNLAAAVAGVEFNQSHQLEMLNANLRLQTVPLQAALELGVERFLQVSSVCVYAPDCNHPAEEDNGREGEPHPANRGYAWAKRLGEIAAECAAQAGLHTVIVRPSNCYGPHDHFDERAHVIPALIKRILGPEPEVKVNGSGQEIREFLYSTDAAAGMIAALERGDKGRIYNIGTHGSTACSIYDLVETIQDAVSARGERKPVVFVDAYNPGDEARWSDTGRAAAELGWHSRVSLYEGVRKTVEWYRNNVSVPAEEASHEGRGSNQ
jgi:GDP-L-fucose synthase